MAHTGVRLILDLNLITDRADDRDGLGAGGARPSFPRGSIVGFEIGNEPDIYSRWFWLTRMARTGSTGGSLPRDLTPADYSRDFATYARLLHRLAPGTPLLGPAVANPTRHLSWISDVVAREHDRMGTVTAHRYPYSACVSPALGQLPDGRAGAQREGVGAASPARLQPAVASRPARGTAAPR